MEQAALHNFLAAPGILRDALMRYTQERAQEHNALCAAAMSTVPRDPERAADHAAKAQELAEFWDVLADALTSFATPSQEPTPRDEEE